jgi:four helix bundle protein
MEIKSHRDLLVWQRGIELAKVMYALTDSFPKSELYGLTSQLRRASTSVSGNIAEGHGRGSRRDYCHFVSIAFGSAMECDTLLHIAMQVRATDAGRCYDAAAKLDEVSRMLNALRIKLQQPVSSPKT